MKAFIALIVLAIAAAAFVFYRDAKKTEAEIVATSERVIEIEGKLARKKEELTAAIKKLSTSEEALTLKRDELEKQKKLLKEKNEAIENIFVESRKASSEAHSSQLTLSEVRSEFVYTSDRIKSMLSSLAVNEAQLGEADFQAESMLKKLSSGFNLTPRDLEDYVSRKKEGVSASKADYRRYERAIPTWRSYQTYARTVDLEKEKIKLKKEQVDALKIQQTASRELLKKTLINEMPARKIDGLSDSELVTLAAASSSEIRLAARDERTSLDAERDALASEVRKIESRKAELENEIYSDEKRLDNEKYQIASKRSELESEETRLKQTEAKLAILRAQ